MISGQVPQVLLLLHLVRLLSQLSSSFIALQNDTISLPLSAFFYRLPHLLSCSSSISLGAISVLSVSISFFLWLMRLVTDINLNQVIRSHKSWTAHIFFYMLLPLLCASERDKVLACPVL